MNAKPFVLLAIAIGIGNLPRAQGQQGVTVQLPTFSFFSVATTVLVPDRGGAAMASVGRVRSGSNRFGPGPAQGAFGFEHHAANMHVSVQIHDLRAMDEAIRGKAGPLVQGLSGPRLTKAESLPSLQQIAEQQRANEQSQQAEALDFLKRAGEAQSAGKPSLAQTYLKMALRRAQGDLREQIAAQLADLASEPAACLAGPR